MPYVHIEDLPIALRAHLPLHAQEIYRAAFNSAYRSFANHPRREEAAHRVAWAAVKRSYIKQGGYWVPRAPAHGLEP